MSDPQMLPTPTRIQLSRAAGWRMPEKCVSVARPGRWGNPFREDVFGRERCIALFENTVQGFWSPGLFADEEPDELVHAAYQAHCAFRKRHGNAPYVHELRGKSLGCWCRIGTPCHADVLLKLANEGRE